MARGFIVMLRTWFVIMLLGVMSPELRGEWISGGRGWNYSNADTNFYPWSTACKVGIGTVSPIERLHIIGNLHLSGGARDISVPPDNYFQLGHYDGTTFTERLWIKTDGTMIMAHNGGNVGIGTTSPGYNLEVVSATAGDGSLFKVVSGAGYTEIDVGTAITLTGYPSSAGDIFLKTYGTGGVLRTGLQIDSYSASYPHLTLQPDGGNVGIGTTGPDGILDVTSSGTPEVYIQTSAGSSQDAILHIKGARTNSTTSDIAQIRLEDNAYGDIAYITARKQTAATNEGNLLFWTTTTNGGTPTEKMRINKDGDVTGIHGTYHTASDVRLKKDIVTIPNALEKVLALRGVNFRWKDPNKPQKTRIGMIAQEVEPVVPEVVHTANDKMKTKAVEYQHVVALLVEAIKEQQKEIDAQQKEIEELKARIRD